MKNLKKFLSRKISAIALFVMIIMLLGAIFGPYLCKYSPYDQNPQGRLQGISARHWLGTDYAGRDTFTRLIYGAKVSLGTAFAGVFMGLLLGVGFGLVAGYFGGLTDSVISRAIELLMAFPGMLLAIVTIVVIGKGDMNTAIAVAISAIPSFMRITRSVSLSIKETDFVKSCFVIGESDLRIILTHILPNTFPLIIVNFTLNLGTALLTVSGLSYLGIGVNPPVPEWGAMVASGRDAALAYPLGILAPGIAITLFVMCASLIGDGLRDVLDPRV